MTPEQLGLKKVGYRISEAIQILPIGKTKLYELIKLGKIKRKKLGRSSVLLTSDILALLETLEQEGEKSSPKLGDR